MPNDHFHFKQFTIHQNRCAMKVTTDACIFGAWVPVPEGARLALDVGTGTGVLSLMLAQRFPDLNIDCVEIDADAAAQAADNIAASKFASRVRVIHGDVRELVSKRPYDVIFSNPPYFQNSLRSPERARSLARHGTELPLKAFLQAAKRLTNDAGSLAVIVPKGEEPNWTLSLMRSGWHMSRMLDIRTRLDVIRSILVFGRQPVLKNYCEELLLLNSDGGLTSDARNLLQPFLLKL